MFDPEPNKYLVISLVVLLLAVLLFFEWKRKTSLPRKISRMIASAFLCLAILFLVIRLQVERKVVGRPMIYLTKGYDASVLDSLKKKHIGISVFSQADVKSKGRKVASLQHLKRLDKRANPVFVLGYGLNERELSDSTVIRFFPREPLGILDVTFSEKVTLGDSVGVATKINAKDPMSLKIAGPDGTMDSVIVQEGMSGSEFRFVPKTPGNHIYKIMSASGEIEEQIAIKVLEKPLIRIVMLNEYPSFEANYLKNWLAKEGHQVTVRNKVSKANYRYEYLNTEEVPFWEFTNEHYDMAFLDLETLDHLSSRELSQLKEGIGDGMSLFVFSDDDILNSSWLKDLFGFSKSTVNRVLINGQMMDAQGWQFGKGRFLQDVFFGDNDKVVAQKRWMGNGNIVLSSLEQTYPLILQGHSDIYDRYWREILSSGVTLRRQPTQWEFTPGLPKEGAPLEIELVTSVENPELVVDGRRLPVIRDVLQTDTWRGKFWPRKAGWLDAQLGNDSTTRERVFIYSDTSFQSVAAFENYNATKLLASSGSGSSDEVTVKQPLSNWWWYFIVILCLTFLWVEPKI